MADLTASTKPVLDGTGATITTQVYVDPNNANANGPLTAVLLKDGSILGPGQALASASVPVVLPAAQITTLAAPVVSGTVAVTGVSTAANQATIIDRVDGVETLLTSVLLDTAKIPALGQALAASSTPVVLTAAQITSLTAPVVSGTVAVTGVSTAEKQPALGTAGSASTDVITVQGIASGVAQTVNITQVVGSAIAQGHGTAATAIRVELPTDGTGVVGLIAGSAIVGRVGIDQTTPGTTDSVSVKTTGYTAQTTVTRPANTTPYGAGDVVGGAIQFSTIGPSGGQIVITGADLRIDVAAIPSGMTTFRLYLYNVTPPSAIADNSAWDLPSGDRASFLGYIDLGTVLDLVATLFVENDSVQKKILLSGSANVFGYLVTAGAFTPAGNSEVYTPRLQAIGV